MEPHLGPVEGHRKQAAVPGKLERRGNATSGSEGDGGADRLERGELTNLHRLPGDHGHPLAVGAESDETVFRQDQLCLTIGCGPEHGGVIVVHRGQPISITAHFHELGRQDQPAGGPFALDIEEDQLIGGGDHEGAAVRGQGSGIDPFLQTALIDHGAFTPGNRQLGQGLRADIETPHPVFPITLESEQGVAVAAELRPNPRDPGDLPAMREIPEHTLPFGLCPRAIIIHDAQMASRADPDPVGGAGLPCPRDGAVTGAGHEGNYRF